MNIRTECQHTQCDGADETNKHYLDDLFHHMDIAPQFFKINLIDFNFLNKAWTMLIVEKSILNFLKIPIFVIEVCHE